MNRLQDLIYYFIDNGGNIDLLLEATGIDKTTFSDKLEWAKFDSVESKLIRKTIKEWEDEFTPEN